MWPAGITVIPGAPPIPWFAVIALGVLLLIGGAIGLAQAYAAIQLWRLRIRDTEARIEATETRRQLDSARLQQAGRRESGLLMYSDERREHRRRYTEGEYRDFILS